MVKSYHQLNGYEFEQTQEIVEDRGAWRVTIHGVTNSQTWLNDWTTAKSSLTLRKILSDLSIHPSFPPTPESHWSFYCVQSFAFSRMPWSWYLLVLNSVSLIFFSPIPGWGDGSWVEGPGAKGTVDVITSKNWGPLVTSPSPDSRTLWVKQGEWNGEGQSQPPDPCHWCCCLLLPLIF